MKFRSKMVLAYTTVALLGSLILGIIVARLGFQYEMTIQKNNLRVAAKSYVMQMDEVLGRMDAIMHYILSDASTLGNITLLSKEKSENIPNWSILDAKAKLRTGLSTDYIMKNSYQAMTTRLDKAVQEEKRATTLQLQAQFNMLQAQVNPHFIYNVLNTISSRAILANDEVICEICGSFGNMLRYSTSNKERYASVEQELEYLESYFYLLKARHGERLEVSMDIDEEVRKQIIPKMTLQQLVENSVKHGLQTMDKSIHISVTGRMERDGWTIRIQDNGLGITEEKLLEVRKRLKEVHKNIQKKTMAAELEIGGMGIVNTYARCMLLYSEDLIFELGNISEGHGFVVTVGKKMIDKDNQL